MIHYEFKKSVKGNLEKIDDKIPEKKLKTFEKVGCLIKEFF